MPTTPEIRLARLIRHARRGYFEARRDDGTRQRARDWLDRHPSSMPAVDALWMASLEGHGPLADWLESDATPDRWVHELALHTVLACHPFPGLRQWSIQKT